MRGRESLLLPPSTTTQQSLIRYMYAGHFLARWGARMWEFSVGLYMISIWPDSLLFAAVYGVVESASIAIFGPIVGKIVDRLTYIQVLRIWLITQNLSFILAGGTVTALLFLSHLMSQNFNAFMLLVIVTHVSGAVGVLSTLAGTILIEREWVVVISNGQPPEILTKMNSVIRRIDLTSKLMAPVFSGFIISFISLGASALMFTLWNLVSVWLEYYLLKSVYTGIPSLSETCERRNQQHVLRNVGIQEVEDEERNPEFQTLKAKITSKLSKLAFIHAWIVYSNQEIVLPGVSLALLYFTVLSFGTLMTATLEWKGVPAYLIAIVRGVSAMIGITATVLYPILHSYISTLRTGLWSIWAQWCCLLVCVASVWVSSGVASAWMLMCGVAASRLGLWMFDLSVIQQMQDLVPESDRCVVGGVQNSLQSTLDLLTYIMGIIISNPQDFGELVILSFLMVLLAALLYTFYVYRAGNHLLHLDRILSNICCSCWRCLEFRSENVRTSITKLITAMPVVELKVGIHCEKCNRAIKKAIKKIEDIETYKVDTEMNKITVTGDVTAEQVLRVLQKIGKTATYWNQEEKEESKKSQQTSS